MIASAFLTPNFVAAAMLAVRCLGANWVIASSISLEPGLRAMPRFFATSSTRSPSRMKVLMACIALPSAPPRTIAFCSSGVRLSQVLRLR